jgi:hypothetical protein
MIETAPPPAPPRAEPIPSVLDASFAELYARHLCRHSQWGNNAIHFIAVAGAHLCAFGLLCGLAGSRWPLLAVAAPYLAIVVRRIPARLAVALPAFFGLVYLALGAAPALPLWAYPVLGFASYKLQQVGHLLFRVERDMTGFAARYPKGPALTRLLFFYELPILIEYLVFDSRSWSR